MLTQLEQSFKNRTGKRKRAPKVVDKTHPCPEFSFCVLHTNLAELERVGMQFRSNSMEQVYFCTLDLLVQCNSTHQTIEKLSHDFLRHFSTLYIEISLCET